MSSYTRYLKLVDLRAKAEGTLKLLDEICELTTKPSDWMYHAHCDRMHLFTEILDGLIHQYRAR